MLSPFSDFGFKNGLKSFVFRLYMIVYIFFRFYASYFSTSPGRGDGDMLHFFDFALENGLNRLYTIVYVFFPLYTSYFSSSPKGEGGLGTCHPPFLILDSKMDSIVCILFVHLIKHLIFATLPVNVMKKLIHK